MTEVSLISLTVIIVSVILLTIVARSRRHPWPGPLHRLHAGVQHRAEWMAPEEIVRTVEADYLAAVNWTSEALLTDYTRFLNEATDYYQGNYLKRQRKIAATHMQGGQKGTRFIGILRTAHRLRVRHFSDDGLTCYIVDYQTNRCYQTYEYWQLRHLHTQKLTPAAYVFRMAYDKASRRWKIDDLIQQLPLGWEEKAMSDTSIRLDDSLPIAAGRDT